LTIKQGIAILFLFVCILLEQNDAAIGQPRENLIATVDFELSMTESQLAKRDAVIQITVPHSVRGFHAPKWYGGAPNFLHYAKKITATDVDGQRLAVKIHDNIVDIEPTRAAKYTLFYTYAIPQKITDKASYAYPVANENYARFDDNVTFLSPIGGDNLPATLSLTAPSTWKVDTSWGSAKKMRIAHVYDLISGLIVMGHLDCTELAVGQTHVRFAMYGNYEHDILREQFGKVLAAQQSTVGNLPSPRLLVAVLPTGMAECRGTSLTNSLCVCLPQETKLVPFNFSAIGTISHELFHQWNVRLIKPKREEGVFLFTEGFTNYFAVAALTRAGLITEERFARFLCSYRKELENNPRYPGSTYAIIQAGLKKEPRLFDLCYTKGPFVAVLLDIALRDDTDDKESLTSYFGALCKKYGGTSGFEPADLRAMLIEKSGKKSGKAVRTFDNAFIGGGALNLDDLFNRLGIERASNGKCELRTLPAAYANLRSNVFTANGH
jgi:predicted metalloprotease with PDZ domain